MDARVAVSSGSISEPPTTTNRAQSWASSALADAATPWTGGHQSALRIGLALWLLVRFGADALSIPAMAVGDATALALALAAALALAVGWFSRSAAVVCAVALGVAAALVLDAGVRLAAAQTPIVDLAVALLLVWIVAAPAAPWGSVDAMGRIDPGGDWCRPAWQGRAARSVLAGAIVAGFVLMVRATVAAPNTAPNPIEWAPGLLAAFALWCFAALDPAWISRLGSDDRDVVLYDGGCGLCHRAVRWLLAEDPADQAFRFAALGGETWETRIEPHDRAVLPDSVVVLTCNGLLLTRWRAVRHLMARLGGGWRLLGACLGWVPLWLGDWIYDAIAAARHRIFAKPKDACPLLPPALRARMLP